MKLNHCVPVARFNQDGKWVEKPVLKLTDEEFTAWILPVVREEPIAAVRFARDFWHELKDLQESEDEEERQRLIRAKRIKDKKEELLKESQSPIP